MEELLKETAKQVPNLATLGLIVWLFLSHEAKRDAAFNEIVKNIHQENVEYRAAAHLVIRENTDSNRAVVKAVAELVSNYPAAQRNKNV